MLPDLEDLMNRLGLDSDENAFADLFRRYFPGLLSFANSIVKDQYVAEEIVEDVFVKIWKRRKELLSIQHFSQYIHTAVKNGCFSYLKDKKRLVPVEMGESIPYATANHEIAILHRENIHKIVSAINELPPKCRLIFRLIKDEGMKYSEVATLLDISERTVNAQLCIAINRISASLQQSLPEFAVYYGKRKSN